MKDGPVRTLLKRAALGCFLLNLGLTRLVWRLRGDKPYLLGGECRRCAACCEQPSIQVGRLTWHFPTVRRLFLGWQRRVNGFELVERIPGQRVFVFRCTHLDGASRLCDSYDTRPGMCRDYPRLLLWQVSPEFLPRCGHRPVHPMGKSLLEALEKEEIDEDKIQEVKKKLFLE